ncbi:unnamed protein product, partial [Mesorhabditis belari]|uniref:RNA helicase n=1 Tax=Mesorhabditis belari TaxID=2138241 RepID=A0AAF3F4T8_9BILA
MSNACEDLILESSDESDEEQCEDGSSAEEDVVEEDLNVEGSSSEEEDEEGVELAINHETPQPVQVPEVNTTWEQLGLSRWLLDQLKELNLKRPTPVQACCIPKVMEGCDVLGCAKTGTGKTFAFGLPILNELAFDPYGVFALVLTPTRELALQIQEQFAAIGKVIGLKCLAVIGGIEQIKQASDLSKRPHVVVATPGKLADYIETHQDSMGQLFRKIKYFVLDEADRMLDGQYNEQLKVIFQSLPPKRQTLLFSATITSAINKLHQVSVRKPYFFEDKGEGDEATVEKLEQKYVLCPVNVKDAYLVYVVKNYCEKSPKSSVIVFALNCRECQALALMFTKLGFQVGSLHSQVSQKDRSSALARFRARTLRVLICTDVAARGLDIPNIDLVVNHNVPDLPKTYIHRVGRSARAGRYGAALTFVTQYDIALLKSIEKTTGKLMEEQKVNDKMVSRYVTQVLVTKREAELTLDQQKFGEKKLIQKRKELILSGMDPIEADRIIEEKRKTISDRGAKRASKLQSQVEKRRPGMKRTLIEPVEGGDKNKKKKTFAR